MTRSEARGDWTDDEQVDVVMAARICGLRLSLMIHKIGSHVFRRFDMHHFVILA
jgi:hypothetical protein